MARTVDTAAHALRREEFLDAAQRLLETKGYERMSVQDVLAETGASKGAFYHYFASKQALLEAVVTRIVENVAAHLAPVAEADERPAVERLRRFFAALGGWKTGRRDLIVAVMRVWHSDANAVARRRLRAATKDVVAPLLAGVVASGIEERVFAPADPERLSRALVSLVQGLEDELSDLFFAVESGAADLAEVRSTVAAYTTAMERTVGAPEGSLELVDDKTLRAWFGPRRATATRKAGGNR